MSDPESEKLRKIAKRSLYREPIELIPPTKGQMTRAFFMVDPNEKLPENVKKVTKYLVKNPSGTVDGIYEGVSDVLGKGEVKTALDWLDYRKFISVIDEKYSVDQTNLKILKDLLKR